jgi:hypothetical protein
MKRALILAACLCYGLLARGDVTVVVGQPVAGGGGTTTLAFHAAASGTGSGTTLSFNHTLTGTQINAYVFVGVVTNHWGGHSVSGVTYDGAAMTAVGSPLNIDGSTNYLTTFRIALGSKAAGAYAVVVSTSTSVTISAAAISFVGVDQATPIGTAATRTGYTNAPTLDVSSATGEIVVDFNATRTDKTTTAGAGQTERVNLQRIGCSTESGASTTTMSWSWTGDVESASIGIPIKPN